jgi:phosphoribosyl 1,2-cyclic phosphodiesterase
MHLRVLGSSSGGNATILWNAHGALLVDCGFSPSYLFTRLDELKAEVRRVTGVLITHAHTDHVNDRSIDGLLERGVHVYARHELKRTLVRMYPSVMRANRLGALRDFDGQEIEVGGFAVSAFPVPHDAPGGCFGFVVTEGEGLARKKAVVTTDLGNATPAVLEACRDVDALVVESNHDLGMLEASGRPPWLIRRIKEIGHLSNDQCSDLVERVAQESERPPRAVLLAHISQQCNTNALAVETTTRSLDRLGCRETVVLESHQHAPSKIVSLD